METRYDMRLNFLTDRNAIKTLTIPRAEPETPPSQVAEAMQNIIDSGVVISTLGEPRTHHSAELVTTHRKEFNIL
jgi:glycerol dehydrogenase-like iron-containing ADH family enzyme